MTEVLMFPGQGSQHPGMGGGLFDRYPRLVEQAGALLGLDVRRMCLDDPDGLLNETRYTQPAVYVVNALTCRAMREGAGRTWPDILLGHSLGEYNALEAAGAFTFLDGLRLVATRARLTSRVPGAMTAVLGLDERRIRATLEERHLTGVDLANLNTPRQTVLSGATEQIALAERALEAAGALDIRRLAVSGPFHSRRMGSVAREWEELLATVTFRTPKLPVVANSTARPHGTDGLRDLLAEHIRLPVRWHESVRWIVDHHRDVRFWEAGNRGFLLRMLRQISPGHGPPPGHRPEWPTHATTSTAQP